MPIGVAGHIGLTLLQRPRDSASVAGKFISDVRSLTASEPVSAKVVPDDVSCSPEPALTDGCCFRRFLCWFHHTFFVLCHMRSNRMGALSLHQSPRCPHGSLSRRNLANALKFRVLERRRRTPSPIRSITPRPKLEIH